jgi:GTP-binding protein YchF
LREIAMRIGLFGFPLTGKSTLFRLLTGVDPTGHGGRGDAAIGVARVVDPRLDVLTEMYQPKKKVPATVEYLDLAGMGKGEAAKVLPLDKLRTADALAHVVRAFRDENVPHSEGNIDPARDVDLMETEFLLADQIVVEKRIEKLEQQIQKTHKDEEKRELATLRRCMEALEAETPLRNLDLDEQEAKTIRGYTFLSQKPLLVVVNADEADSGKLDLGAAAFGLDGLAGRPRTAVVALSARIESEIAQLDDADAASFREDLGIHEPALARMIRASYGLLGRMSFFTVGDDECRAWTVPSGISAHKAAGTIHSDIERGFIRAELVAYDALVEAGSWSAARERGTLRLEGKDYVMNDGDVVNFRFNV